MPPIDAIDMAREAIVTGMWLVAPILLACLAIALGIGFLQSLTQIHDSTVSFIPKIALVAIVIVICLPWMASRFSEFAASQLDKPVLMTVDSSPSRQ